MRTYKVSDKFHKVYESMEKAAKVIDTHQVAEKFGPIFVPYDPLLSALLAMNF